MPQPTPSASCLFDGGHCRVKGGQSLVPGFSERFRQGRRVVAALLALRPVVLVRWRVGRRDTEERTISRRAHLASCRRPNSRVAAGKATVELNSTSIKSGPFNPYGCSHPRCHVKPRSWAQAAIWARVFTPSLARMLPTWVAAVRSLMKRASAISRLE